VGVHTKGYTPKCL